MNDCRPTTRILIVCCTLLFTFFTVSSVAQNGQTLFQQKCASCHIMGRPAVGPNLVGAEDRWNGDRKKLASWIRNSAAMINNGKGDPYAVKIWEENNKTLMTSFTDLKDEEIEALLNYIRDWKPPVPTTPGDPNGEKKPESSDSTLLFGILTLILAVIALILLQVNSNLKKLSDDKEGIPAPEPVPFFRNKAYIALGIIVLFMVGGYYTIQGAVGLGRMKNYQPVQPIYYSHKVHAGVNQINCLYCHGGAMEGKHANIPSVNVCMNCHMAINEYAKGPKLFDENGTEVDGTAEIQKLYAAAGWDPKSQKYTGKGKPVEWVRIHNLPDHVYFNHSQHVKAGKVQCQTCHGEIHKMDEVYQFSDLSMGWCVNCHRETKVQFTDNKFYSIYEKFHEDIKNKKMDSVTVEKIGGTECQKCHY